LADSIIQVQPGNNDIDSYIDIVGSDDLASSDLEATLAEFRGRLQQRTNSPTALGPETADLSHAAIGFYASQRAPDGWEHEFETLGRVIVQLLERRAQSSRPPLQIERHRIDGGFQFALSAFSREIVARSSMTTRPTTVHISTENLEIFERFRGAFLEEVPLLVLEAEEQAHGLFSGFRVVDADTNEVLLERDAHNAVPRSSPAAPTRQADDN